jgi:hypothetical protein
MSSKLSPYCVSILVNQYIGKEVYSHSSKEIKYILISDAMRQFQLEMVQKFGSLRNYTLDWMKRNGFENDKEYVKYLAETKGVDTNNEYQIVCAKEAGFKSRYDRMLKKAKEQGFVNLSEKYLKRFKERGFNSQREYRDFLCKKNGVNNYSQLLRIRKDKSHYPINEEDINFLRGIINDKKELLSKIGDVQQTSEKKQDD